MVCNPMDPKILGYSTRLTAIVEVNSMPDSRATRHPAMGNPIRTMWHLHIAFHVTTNQTFRRSQGDSVPITAGSLEADRRDSWDLLAHHNPRERPPSGAWQSLRGQRRESSRRFMRKEAKVLQDFVACRRCGTVRRAGIPGKCAGVTVPPELIPSPICGVTGCTIMAGFPRVSLCFAPTSNRRSALW